jgi:hypothetical protein
LQRTFDVLNQYRLQTNMDTYSLGRNPTFLEPTLIVLLTDGGALTSTTAIAPPQLTLPVTNDPGAELSLEPFRWDQRLYALLLPFAATDLPDLQQPGGAAAAATVAATNAAAQPPVAPTPPASPLAPMCEVTGGKCITARSLRHALQLVENLATRHTSVGVNVLLEPMAPIPSADALSHGLRRKLLVRPNAGRPWWPIPEAFTRDALGGKKALPPRSALPVVRFAASEANPAIPDNFPFDKYELEPSPLTEHMLRTARGGCLPCVVPGSGARAGREEPFGYLKASTTSGTVSLYVLPFNYPRLFQLVNELRTTHRMVPSLRWRTDFEAYCQAMPHYYAPPLRNALKIIGANVVPEHWDGQPPRHVRVALQLATAAAAVNAAKRMAELGAVRDAIANGATATEATAAGAAAAAAITSVPEAEAIFANLAATNNGHGAALPPAAVAAVAAAAASTESVGAAAARPAATAPTAKTTDKALDAVVNVFAAGHDVDVDGLPLGAPASVAGGGAPAPTSTALPLVPSALTRNDLLLALDRLRTAARLPPVRASAEAAAAARVSMPIATMGDYTELMLRNPPLRDVDPTVDNKPMFGNPFRTIQKRMPGDETDLALMDGVGPSGPQPRRTRGPQGSQLRESSTAAASSASDSPPPTPTTTLPPPPNFVAPTQPQAPIIQLPHQNQQQQEQPDAPESLQQQQLRQPSELQTSRPSVRAAAVTTPTATQPPPPTTTAPTTTAAAATSTATVSAPPPPSTTAPQRPVAAVTPSTAAAAAAAATSAAAAVVNRKRPLAPGGVAPTSSAKAPRNTTQVRRAPEDDEEEEDDDIQPEFDSLASAFRAGTLLQNQADDSSSAAASSSSAAAAAATPVAASAATDATADKPAAKQQKSSPLSSSASAAASPKAANESLSSSSSSRAVHHGGAHARRAGAAHQQCACDAIESQHRGKASKARPGQEDGWSQASCAQARQQHNH